LISANSLCRHHREFFQAYRDRYESVAGISKRITNALVFPLKVFACWRGCPNDSLGADHLLAGADGAAVR
jgi:hypothetical protein